MAFAHKWCPIVRNGPCCDKNVHSEEGGNRCTTNVVTGVASVTGFVIEATTPISVRIPELSSSPIRKPMHAAQINRLPRKQFNEIQHSDQSEMRKWFDKYSMIRYKTLGANSMKSSAVYSQHFIPYETVCWEYLTGLKYLKINCAPSV